MSNSHIQNCHVTLSGDEIALGCDYQGVRYHVWLQDDLTPMIVAFHALEHFCARP